MIASFKDIATAMTRCVAIIEDYARLAPSTLTTSAALAAVQDGTAVDLTASGKKRAKKEKKPKDPNAPKRPPSAYLLFQNDIREEIRRAHPGLPYKEVLSVIASRWKDLSEQQRKGYEDAYNAATTQFREADEAYKLTGHVPPHLLLPPATSLAASFAAIPGVGAGLSDSDEDSNSSDDNATPSKLLPPTLAATPLTSTKKDKKRKKDSEAAVVTPIVDGKDKVRFLQVAQADRAEEAVQEEQGVK